MIKNFILEFKKFAMRGNVMDMAVGIIIGSAFTKIVDSLVKDILMPPLGILMGKIDFANLYITLRPGNVAGPYASLDAAKAAGAVTWNLGFFINAIISFVIVAFAVFLLIKAMNLLQAKFEDKKKDEAPAAPTTKVCPYCKSEIAIDATKCPHCTSDLK
ncbi:MAG: large conductance mechanosensitive channel protein MscL [Alphaproteobacteria bacterium]|nr:large conductance mechanosensitive channel protein MscL [Alphaproteobacteria bacterium]